MNNAKDIDDCMYRLQQVFEVYNKKISEGAARVWRELFCEHEKDDVMKALNDVLKTFKLSPKPADIEEIIGKYKTTRGEKQPYVYKGNCPLTRKALADEAKNPTKEPAGANIHTAWCIFHKMIHGEYLAINNEAKLPKMDMSKSEALHIVNQQAAKHDWPNLIPAKYKIQSYWQEQEDLI